MNSAASPVLNTVGVGVRGTGAGPVPGGGARTPMVWAPLRATSSVRVYPFCTVERGVHGEGRAVSMAEWDSAGLVGHRPS